MCAPIQAFTPFTPFTPFAPWAPALLKVPRGLCVCVCVCVFLCTYPVMGPPVVMDAAEFVRRVQDLGPLSGTHIARRVLGRAPALFSAGAPGAPGARRAPARAPAWVVVPYQVPLLTTMIPILTSSSGASQTACGSDHMSQPIHFCWEKNPACFPF